MKRLLALFLCLCVLFCSCGASVPAKDEDVEPDPSGSVSSDPASSAADDPGPSAEPEPASEPVSFMDNRTPLGSSGNLWEIPNETIRQGRYQTLTMWNDDLLVSYTSAECLHLQLLDGLTGELKYTAELHSVWDPRIQICDDKAAVVDIINGWIVIFDETLTQVKEYAVPASWDTLYLSPDCATAYTLLWEGGIEVCDLETGTTSLLLENSTYVYAVAQRGQFVTVSYTDTGTGLYSYCALDLSDGTITENPFPDAFTGMEYADGNWLGTLIDKDLVIYGNDMENASVFSTEVDEVHFCAKAGSLISSICTFDDEGTNLYNTFCCFDADGSIQSSCVVPLGIRYYVSGEPVWCSLWNGWFLLLTNCVTTESTLLFWDASALDDLPVLESRPYTDYLPTPGSGNSVAQMLYDRAAALSEQYGINIYIADECATEYDEFYVDPCTDFWCISYGLDQLEEALSYYPENFLPQLMHDNVRSIDVNLVGTLTRFIVPEDSESADTYAAFVQHDEDRYIMVMDVSSGSELVSSFCHEISHMVDSKLEADSWLRDDALYSESGWAALNPDDFGYAWSYYYLSDSCHYGEYYDYFIDDYSRTFPTEDRARIMEYAITAPWYFEDSPCLLAKLSYYSACIRDALDTTGWPEVCAWEQPLVQFESGDAAE